MSQVRAFQEMTTMLGTVLDCHLACQTAGGVKVYSLVVTAAVGGRVDADQHCQQHRPHLQQGAATEA